MSRGRTKLTARDRETAARVVTFGGAAALERVVAAADAIPYAGGLGEYLATTYEFESRPRLVHENPGLVTWATGPSTGPHRDRDWAIDHRWNPDGSRRR